MAIVGIDEVSFGVEDLPRCHTFLADWGLTLVTQTPEHEVWQTRAKASVILKHRDDPSLPAAFEAGPTIRQVVWGVDSQADLAQLATALRDQAGFNQQDGCLQVIDPNGLGLGFRISQKQPIHTQPAKYNNWGDPQRIDSPAPVYSHATPLDIGHVVLFVRDVAAASAFYQRIGFVLSDEYPGRGRFLRCAARGDHHNLFLLQTPERRHGLNHLAFTVQDIHEVFGGGLHMSRQGWPTQLGPGRHPISSAYFWYFRNPAGGLIEYYADEDHLTEQWQPRQIEPAPEKFAEWAISGGIDGYSRRQHDAGRQSRQFLTE